MPNDWFSALGKPVPMEGREAALQLLVSERYARDEAAMVIAVVAREVEHDNPERAQNVLLRYVGKGNLTLMYRTFATMLATEEAEPAGASAT